MGLGLCSIGIHSVRKKVAYLSSMMLALGVTWSNAQNKAESDQQIRQKLIRESIASYSGNCPCPYNTDRAGRSCGRRSAYSRPGGRHPLCYERDVTTQMLEHYKKQAAQK
jgi:hypothetical protein